jgi:hypothetical protein
MRIAQIAVEAVHAATVAEVRQQPSPLEGPPGDLGVALPDCARVTPRRATFGATAHSAADADGVSPHAMLGW